MRETLTGLILAGGQGLRMGARDKGLLAWRGQPLVAHACAGLRPQVDGLLISANRNLADYAAYGTVVPDDPALGNYQGPLAGVASALPVAPAGWVLTWACDMPRVPADLASRLLRAAHAAHAPLAVAATQGRWQPVCMLADTTLLPGLLDYLSRGERRVQGWLRAAGAVAVDFDDQAEAFDNLNTPEDLAREG